MSSFVGSYNNGEPSILSFREYLLSESIRPKKVAFGTNPEFNNKKIENLKPYSFTSFKLNDKIYHVAIREDGEIGFHYIDEFEYFEKDSYIRNVMKNDFKTRGKSPAIKVFSYVFYTVLQLLDKTKLTEIYFLADGSALDTVYKQMVKNKYFLESINSTGFKFTGIYDDKYTFRKELT